jgi:hypothetical protein
VFPTSNSTAQAPLGACALSAQNAVVQDLKAPAGHRVQGVFEIAGSELPVLEVNEIEFGPSRHQWTDRLKER